MIGVTIFYSVGNALQVAGPSGALLAFAIVGIVAICVMECVSELIQMFPTPNAIVEFVRIFVDADLAWVIGVGYWSDYIIKTLFALWLISTLKVYLRCHLPDTNHCCCEFYRILASGSSLPNARAVYFRRLRYVRYQLCRSLCTRSENHRSPNPYTVDSARCLDG